MAVYELNGNSLCEPKVYEIMTYNIGNFDNSGGHDGYDGDDLEGTIAKWIKFLGGCKADVCLLQESRSYVDKNQTALSKERIYDVTYKDTSTYNPSVSWGEAMLSNLPKRNIINGIFTTTLASEAKYLGALININGINIMVISVHLNHGRGTDYDNARIAQANEIVQIASNYENVIIGGDYNTDDSSTLSVFKNNGYSLANNDIFGTFITYVDGGAIDNIAVRGNKLKMKSVNLLDGVNTDDHFPLIADILIG